MKLLLLLLLITTNALADISVSVLSTRNPLPYKATFKTEVEADKWIASNTKNNSWGKPDRWKKFTDGSHTNTREVERETIEGEVKTYTEYFFPVEYVITKTDITDEVNAAKAERLARKEDIKQMKLDITKLKDDETISPLVRKMIIRLIKETKE